MDTSSLKSSSSKPRTPGIDGPKKVGFARPTLIIPPPQAQKSYGPVSAGGHSIGTYNTGPYTPGSIHTMSSLGGPKPGMYGRKASMFMNRQFVGIRDFTMNTAKSGLGIGEKCSYWFYAKIRLWSRKWFTHCFLSIVMTLYTVGGAIMFVYIEGTNEDQLKDKDLHDDRYRLIRILRNMSIVLPDKTTEREWEGAASIQLREYEDKIVEYYQNFALIVANRGKKIWTLWNAIVYCATVYTTLGMASQPTSRDSNETTDTRTENEQLDIEKIKSLLTEDQVVSDSIARRRRKLTKKRSTSLTKRDITPARKLDEKTTSEDEGVERKSRTPERPRRPKRNKSLHRKYQSETDSPSIESNEVSRNNSFRAKLQVFEEHFKASEERQKRSAKSEERTTLDKPKKRFVRRSEDRERKKSLSDLAQEEIYGFFKRAFEEPKKRFARKSEERKKSLSDLAQEEVVSLFNKTKKSLTNAAVKGRDRFRKDKERAKRSQSAPNKIEDQELIESFKQAQLLEVHKEQKPRKYSESNVADVVPDVNFTKHVIKQPYVKVENVKRPIIKKAKPIRPGSETVLRQRKNIPKYSSKVVEILDPNSKTVVSRKTIVRLPEVGLLDLFRIFKFYSIIEMYREYKKYTNEMKVEHKRIKRLWNKCMFELFLILMFCGIGGFSFKFIEGQFENFYKCGVKRVKRDFIDILWTKSHNLREEDWKSLFRNKLRVFEEELHVAHEAGMTTYSGQRSWSFLNGIVYALSIITTIGYGHIYPTTQTGRALTIVYALVGIPLFLIALTDFGKLFTRAIKFLWSYVRRVYYTGSCRSVRKSAQVTEIFKGAQFMYEIATFRRPSNVSVEDQHPDKPLDGGTPAAGTVNSEQTPTTPDLSTFEIDDEFNLPISVALFILIAYMFIGAVIYCAWERWQFFESFYFVFISLSTVGFGDYVPRNPICMIVSIVYLVFGLALMSMCINVVQLKLSDTFQRASIKLSSTMGFEGPGEEELEIGPSAEADPNKVDADTAESGLANKDSSDANVTSSNQPLTTPPKLVDEKDKKLSIETTEKGEIKFEPPNYQGTETNEVKGS